MASNVDAKLDECVVVYNPTETDSDKISTKLSSTVTEVTAAPGASNSGTKITKVACTSTAEEKRQAKQTSGSLRNVATIFVITEEILMGDARRFLDEMMRAVSENENAKVLTVYYKVLRADLPDHLKVHDCFDYNADDFKTDVVAAIKDLASKPAAVPDPMMFIVSCSLSVEVHPVKGNIKTKQSRTADLKTIREAVYNILMDPSNGLSEILLVNFMLIVRDVGQNPLRVISKVKDEEWWGKVQGACEDRTLGSLIMQHVTAYLQKDLPYEIKVIPQKDKDATQGSAPKPADSIVANVIIDMIKKKEYTTYDFYQKLKSFEEKVDLRGMRSDPDGFNPLHAIIVYNRLPLMLPLVQLKLFSSYLHESVPVTSQSSFRGHTPRQVAESKKARRFKDALQDYERLVHSMGKFLKACHDGDVALVRRMIHTQRQLLQEKDSFRNNCLYWAIVSNNLDLFTLLLDQHADFNNVNESKETLLHVACMLGHSKFIPGLMTRCNMDVTAVCSNKRTPLERVAENGDIESLKELLKVPGVNLTACTLPYAAVNGRLNFLKFVLEETNKPIHKDNRDNTGRSALMKACETGRREVVDYLIGKGASVNVQDLRRRTPLHVACENGHEDIVKVLLEHKAELDVQDYYTGAELCFLIRGKDKGRKAWHYVEVRRNVVHIFLQKTRAGQVDVAVYGTVVKSGWGEDPEKAIVEWVEKMFSDRRNSPSPSHDLTPLHMAIYKQQPGVARILIEKGANITIKDNFGLTPFMLCALRNDKDTAVLLEEKGANISETDKEGHTALAIAEMNDQREMVNYITGKSYFTQTQAYLNGDLAETIKSLQKEHLEELRAKGADVRRHIIDTVRNLTTANNILLHDLGSGPIMKASSGAASNYSGAAGMDSGFGASNMPDLSTVTSNAPVRASDDGGRSSTPVRATDDGGPSGPSANVNSVNRQGFGSGSSFSPESSQNQTPMETDEGGGQTVPTAHPVL